MDRLALSTTQWEQMRSAVAGWDPEEACGLLAGSPWTVKRVYSIDNVLHSPRRFRMDPLQQLRAFQEIEREGLVLIGIYHSHPYGPQEPSPTDLAEFAYPGAAYLIWSKSPAGQWRGRAFMIAGGRAAEITVEIRDGE